MDKGRKHPNKLPGEVMVHRMGHFKLERVMHWKVSEFLGGCALNLKDEGGELVHLGLLDSVSSMARSANSSWFVPSPGLSPTRSTGEV